VTAPPWITEALSAPRFTPYLVAVGGDSAAAMRLYWWNVEVSEAFFVSLHWVETAFRNALHDRLRRYFGTEHWWDVAPLHHDGRAKVVAARQTSRMIAKHPGSADPVVAELSFGFWVSLLGSRYHRTIWVPALAAAFPGLARKAVHTDYRHVLVLRNRIMHHEPIHRRHLAADHATLHRLLAQLSPTALAQVQSHDRVPAVLGRRPKP
jgi:hypothetical protein